MGKRRKKYKRAVKKQVKMPLAFQCPNCGSKTLTVEFEKSEEPGRKRAFVICGTCGLYAEYPELVPDLFQAVDVYAKFVDLYLAGKVKVEFRRREEGGVAEGGQS